MEMEVEIKDIVGFCVLMQNGNGIMDKAPSYVREKFIALMRNDIPFERRLDNDNQTKLKAWCDRWVNGG